MSNVSRLSRPSTSSFRAHHNNMGKCSKYKCNTAFHKLPINVTIGIYEKMRIHTIMQNWTDRHTGISKLFFSSGISPLFDISSACRRSLNFALFFQRILQCGGRGLYPWQARGDRRHVVDARKRRRQGDLAYQEYVHMWQGLARHQVSNIYTAPCNIGSSATLKCCEVEIHPK